MLGRIADQQVRKYAEDYVAEACAAIDQANSRGDDALQAVANYNNFLRH